MHAAVMGDTVAELKTAHNRRGDKAGGVLATTIKLPTKTTMVSRQQRLVLDSFAKSSEPHGTSANG